MPKLLVEAHNVGRTYGHGPATVVALAAATCQVAPGNRIALVGPSGSGKSTLLHLLGGLDTPTTGALTWPALGPRETLRPAKVGFVFQMPSLLAPHTVVENVEIPLLLERVSPARARAQALETLALLDLDSLADKLPEELSGGQAQRVALARALVARPQLICADEPTGQLDQATGQHLVDLLLAALDDTTTALIVATHDPAVVGRLPTRWQIQHGTLEVPA
jgi:putative ABC transport system ATP-binding protein/lipoprotein-releasing system ATP-binding protein